MLLRTMVLGRESDKEQEKQMQEDEVQSGQSRGEALAEQRLCGADWGEVLLWQRRQEMKRLNVGCVKQEKYLCVHSSASKGKLKLLKIWFFQRENPSMKA